jgi:hypothetical protein
LVKERNAKWQRENAEYVKQQRRLPEKAARQRELAKQWRDANKEHVRERARKSREARRLVRNSSRRATSKLSDGRITFNEITRLWDLQQGRCIFFSSCGNHLDRNRKHGYHIDHIDPLKPYDKERQAGGNVIENLQLLCRSCNARKHNLDPYAFAQANGLLFCDITDVAERHAGRRRKS